MVMAGSYTCPALPEHLLAPSLEVIDKSEKDVHEEVDEEQEEGRGEGSSD